MSRLTGMVVVLVGAASCVPAQNVQSAARVGAVTSRRADLWCLKPVVRPQVPAGVTESLNPVDAFLSAKRKEKGLQATGPADKRTLLRRVYLDLIGIPPSPAEQDAFLQDDAPD